MHVSFIWIFFFFFFWGGGGGVVLSIYSLKGERNEEAARILSIGKEDKIYTLTAVQFSLHFSVPFVKNPRSKVRRKHNHEYYQFMSCTGSVTSQTRAAQSVKKEEDQKRHEPTFHCSSFVKSETTWPAPLRISNSSKTKQNKQTKTKTNKQNKQPSWAKLLHCESEPIWLHPAKLKLEVKKKKKKSLVVLTIDRTTKRSVQTELYAHSDRFWTSLRHWFCSPWLTVTDRLAWLTSVAEKAGLLMCFCPLYLSAQKKKSKLTNSVCLPLLFSRVRRRLTWVDYFCCHLCHNRYRFLPSPPPHPCFLAPLL